MRQTVCICICLLVVCGWMAGVARGDEPKGYRITLPEGKIGAAALLPGDYKLLVHQDHPAVQLVHLKTGDTIELPGRVEASETKWDRTEIHSHIVDGVRQISEIRIGGTKFRVEFREAPKP